MCILLTTWSKGLMAIQLIAHSSESDMGILIVIVYIVFCLQSCLWCQVCKSTLSEVSLPRLVQLYVTVSQLINKSSSLFIWHLNIGFWKILSFKPNTNCLNYTWVLLAAFQPMLKVCAICFSLSHCCQSQNKTLVSICKKQSWSDCPLSLES